MNRTTYYYIGVTLMLIGSALLLAAVFQDFTGTQIFDDEPWLVGAGVGAVGAALAAGGKGKKEGEQRVP